MNMSYPRDRQAGATDIKPQAEDRTVAGATADTSVGELISSISDNLSQLFRQEIELAKAELRQEMSKAGKAAGMLSAAGFAGYMVVLLLSLAAVWGLGNVMDLGWAALLVAAFWAIVAAVLYIPGRNRMRTVSPVPRQTVETLKEDAQWLKHPTG